MPPQPSAWVKLEAYVLPQHEIPRVGAIPPMQDFRVADTNMLVYEKPCGPNANPSLPNAGANHPKVTPTQAGGI